MFSVAHSPSLQPLPSEKAVGAVCHSWKVYLIIDLQLEHGDKEQTYSLFCFKILYSQCIPLIAYI